MSDLSSYTPEKESDTITDGYEPPRGFFERNSGPLEEQASGLKRWAEPPLQPLQKLFFKCQGTDGIAPLVECLTNKKPWVRLHLHTSQVWSHEPIITAFRRCGQEDQDFKVL